MFSRLWAVPLLRSEPARAIQHTRFYVNVPKNKYPRHRRRDAPVQRPPETTSASLDQWDSAVQIIKRGQTQSPNYAVQGNLRIALLIDAENIAYRNVAGIMNEVEKLGIVQIRRIYADWTSEIMRGWRQTVLTNALTPVHQFQSSIGKGNTDSMMIIDAMDILYQNKDIDSFCIVSSDADFTRLATKLREQGKLVLGIGSNLTPAPFVVACNRFVYLHNLMKDEPSSSTTPQPPYVSTGAPQPVQQPTARPAAAAVAAAGTTSIKLPVKASAAPALLPTVPAAAPALMPIKTKAKIDMTHRDTKMITKPGEKPNAIVLRTILPILTRAWTSYREDSGWAPIAGVHNELQRIQPGFNVATFGPFERLEELLEATELFEVRKTKQVGNTHMIRRLAKPNPTKSPVAPI